MEYIKLADLVEAVNVNGTDLFIVEDGADTKKITKNTLTEALGIDQLQLDVAEKAPQLTTYDKDEVDSLINTRAVADDTYTKFQTDSKYAPLGSGEIKSYATGIAGEGIISSVFGNVPHMGTLHVVETGTPNYLYASFFKEGTSLPPVVTVIASNVLTLGEANNLGNQPILNASVGTDVRLMAIHHKIYE